MKKIVETIIILVISIFSLSVSVLATPVPDTGQTKCYDNVEIMLVLDRLGSMGPGFGNPILDLKTAAKSFIGFFADTQADDKVGLISFATGVTVNFPLGNNFITPMTNAIDSITAIGATNAEDALAQAGGPNGLPDQSGLPGDQRTQQFVIFFSDGNPTAFRGKFKYNGTDIIDAVACGTGQTCDTVYPQMGNPASETWQGIDPEYTGDGKPQISGGSKCYSYSNRTKPTTKWYVFSQYPVPGYTDPEQCYIPQNTLAPYICTTARQMAVDHAQELKNRYVKIYTIGLGNIDQNFLSSIASGPTFEYYTPSSSDLQALFNAIAKSIVEPTTSTIMSTTTTTISPTYIELASIEAIPGNGSVTVRWKTESEIDNSGFNLYRAESANEEYIKINDSLIATKGSPTQGASYDFIDNDVQNRKTYYYKLEDIDLNGKSTMHEPVNATPRWIFGIFGK